MAATTDRYRSTMQALAIAIAADVPVILWGPPGQGKCLTGDTLIYDPSTGARRRLDEIVAAGERDEPVEVLAMGPDYRLRPTKATEFLRNGVRPVFRVTTRSGAAITATGNHPFRTALGWQSLDEGLRPGDAIGLARALPFFGSRQMPDDSVSLLGALFLNEQRPYRNDGQTKRVPAAIFELDERLTALFLNRLFATGGQISSGEESYPRIGYSSVHRDLAVDVQHLLRRFGILSRVACKAHAGGEADGSGKAPYEVVVTDIASIQIFCDKVGAIGKEPAVEHMRRRIAGRAVSTIVDVVPRQVWDLVEQEKGAVSWGTIAKELRHVRGPYLKGDPSQPDRNDRDVGRGRLAKVAAVIGSKNLSNLATSDLSWDPIVSVEPAGMQETYDIVVPDGHNFVANDLVVHNSSVIEATAKQQGMHCEVVIASFRDPSDFGGLPVITPDGVRLEPPVWAKAIVRAGTRGQNGLVFFDELSTAVPATQAALLRVCTDRVVGDTALPDGVRIVAAANPPEQAADGWDLAAPMANRFVHLDWKLPADVVADGLDGLGWPEIPNLDATDAAPQLGQAGTLVGAFLRSRPIAVTVMPDSASAQGRAYPTPRSWEMVKKLLAVCWATGATAPVVATLLNGAIGDAAAHEFITFMRELNLPNPEDVLADPENYVVPEKAHEAYAVGASCLLAVENNNSPERWRAYGVLLARFSQAGRADMGVVLGVKWVALRPHGAAPPAALSASIMKTLRLSGTVPEFVPGPNSSGLPTTPSYANA